MVQDPTRLDQMRMTNADVESRLRLMGVTDDDLAALAACRPAVERDIDTIIRAFHRQLSGVAELARLLGDGETRRRLHDAQRAHVLDLFSGPYDERYAVSRLKVGSVHWRIGVEPGFFLASVQMLRARIVETLERGALLHLPLPAGVAALERVLAFDVALVLEGYLRSMSVDFESAKQGMEQYARGLERQVAEQAEQLWVDPLTGATNRRFLIETLEQRLRAARRRAEALSLVFIDIDAFKAINDTEGHHRGDEVLKQLAKILRTVGRTEDMCFRFGGDEFCVILANCTAAEAATTYCVRLQKLLAQQLVGVTVSIGVTETGPEAYDEPEALLRRADHQMYDQKVANRKGVEAKEG